MVRHRPFLAVVVALALLLSGGVVVARAASRPVPPKACAAGDRPETGVQGDVPVADQLSGESRQGYRCNIRPVASNDLAGLGGDIQLTWYRDCAYQTVPAGDAPSEGIAVLDVARANAPRLVETLRRDAWAGRGGPVLGIHEGIHASAARGILVIPVGTMISVYDVSRDCRHPAHLADFDAGAAPGPFHDPKFFAAGIHSGQLSPDGRFYYATDIGNGGMSPDGPCLTVFDLNDPRHPRLALRWGADFPCHDLELRPDGNRAYVGFYAPKVGYASAEVAAFTPVGAPSYALSGVRVVDTSDLQAGKPNPTLRILGEITGARQHTEVYTRIGGREYLLGAEEGYCPAGNGRIVDITDERHPVEVAPIELAINTAPNCGQASYNQNGDLLNFTSHYLSVDDPRDAHLAFYSWYGSGLRVFDISDPKRPREIAYFNPAVGDGSSRTHDWTTSYPRYFPDTGQIWFGSRVKGFNVVELAPQLRPPRRDGPVSRTWSVGPPKGRVVAGVASRTLPASEPGVGFCTIRLGG